MVRILLKKGFLCRLVLLTSRVLQDLLTPHWYAILLAGQVQPDSDSFAGTWEPRMLGLLVVRISVAGEDALLLREIFQGDDVASRGEFAVTLLFRWISYERGGLCPPLLPQKNGALKRKRAAYCFWHLTDGSVVVIPVVVLSVGRNGHCYSMVSVQSVQVLHRKNQLMSNILVVRG